jgi:hypothetical protein
MRRDSQREAWTQFVEEQQGIHVAPAPVNKYGNKRVQFNGRWFDSQREANHAAKLQALDERGLIANLQYQVRIPLVPGDGKLRGVVYVADFTYVDANGKLYVQDAKGYKTQIYRLKKRMAALLLGIEIEEV